MRRVDISEFKARCHSLIREVNETGEPLCIARDGQPLAEIIPPSPAPRQGRILGSGADTFDILDNDIVGPIIDLK